LGWRYAAKANHRGTEDFEVIGVDGLELRVDWGLEDSVTVGWAGGTL
jgi:hypothetical protein